MRLLLLGLLLIIVSCAHPKTFTKKDGTKVRVETYGWADKEAYKDTSVVYKISVGNIVWSVLLVETIAAPIILTGCDLYEPVRLKEK